MQPGLMYIIAYTVLVLLWEVLRVCLLSDILESVLGDARKIDALKNVFKGCLQGSVSCSATTSALV